GGVSLAAVAAVVVAAVIRPVVVVVVAEWVVIAAQSDGEADMEAREEPEARLGDEERIRRADDPDTEAAAEPLVARDAPFVEEGTAAIGGASPIERASAIVA